MTTLSADLTSCLGFIIETDKLKGVLRNNQPVTLERHENSAEHSWQVALLALTLQKHAAAPIDINKVIKMLLIHDIGEIDVGDVLVYSAHNNHQHEEEELKAVKRITSLLPSDQAEELLSLWQEFEERKTPEARYARAMDRLMPVLLNLQKKGQSWKENHVSKTQVLQGAVGKIEDGCPEVAHWLRQELDKAEADGYFSS